MNKIASAVIAVTLLATLSASEAAFAITGPFFYDGLETLYRRDNVYDALCTPNPNPGGAAIPWSLTLSNDITVTLNVSFTAGYAPWCEAKIGYAEAKTWKVSSSISGSVPAPPSNAPSGAHVDHHAWLCFESNYKERWCNYQYWVQDGSSIVSAGLLNYYCAIVDGTQKYISREQTYKQDAGLCYNNDCPRPAPFVYDYQLNYVIPQGGIPVSNIGNVWYSKSVDHNYN